jgi:hypothetical protein
MGALRAADCRPAGAIGHGRVYRLFRRRVLQSEDEVAVTFMAERPFPPLTQALVNMRIAIRRARRSGLLDRPQARALEEASHALAYEDRSWAKAAEIAGMTLSDAQRHALACCDVKQEDALSCCRWLAGELKRGALREVPTGPGLIGKISRQRERGPDTLDGAGPDDLREPFLSWLAVSGNGTTEAIDLGNPSPQVSALLMRFAAFRRAAAMAEAASIRPTERDLAKAGIEIARDHGHRSWAALQASRRDDPGMQARLEAYRHERACCLVLKRDVLFAPVPPPQWRRSG